jgi:hypothetical protein
MMHTVHLTPLPRLVKRRFLSESWGVLLRRVMYYNLNQLHGFLRKGIYYTLLHILHTYYTFLCSIHYTFSYILLNSNFSTKLNTYPMNILCIRLGNCRNTSLKICGSRVGWINERKEFRKEKKRILL